MASGAAAACGRRNPCRQSCPVCRRLVAPARLRRASSATTSAGEVALFEPPVGEQRRWRVRPYMRTAKLLTDFPFTAPVTTTVSSADCVPYPWTWPRGDALRSDMLVFEPDEGSTPHEPLLRFFRAGSVSSPAKTLYVLVPTTGRSSPQPRAPSRKSRRSSAGPQARPPDRRRLFQQQRERVGPFQGGAGLRRARARA